ncbi:precorrin-3B synthase [Sphaerisporangium dianthi]|uniref:Precorrin-3B synthase n=1 Tax=Sphaerisporangium dianthi TaxID=1436120 RepID=A0ABV9CN24_9ACTN
MASAEFSGRPEPTHNGKTTADAHPTPASFTRSRPDACPGALQTHEAADGAIARVRTPGGRLTAGRLRALATAAASYGSGVIELTSRANVQVRGLTAETGRAFAERMAAIGLLPSATHERVRNILAGPLSGVDGRGLADVTPLVDELDDAVLARPALAELPGRFLFALDDGRGDMVPLRADVTLLPIPASAPAPAPPGDSQQQDPAPPGDSQRNQASVRNSQQDRATPPDLHLKQGSPGNPHSARESPENHRQDRTAVEVVLLLAGEDTGLRPGLADAVPAMVAAAEAFLAERAAQKSGAWRITELDDGPARITARLAANAPALRAPAFRAPATPSRLVPSLGPGVVAMADGRAALVVLPPLGRLTSAQAHAVADVAAAGTGEIRLSPWRGIVIPGVPAADAGAWMSRLAAMGLGTEPGSPWAGVTACAGRPGCAKSLADVQADAAYATLRAAHHAGPTPAAKDGPLPAAQSRQHPAAHDQPFPSDQGHPPPTDQGHPVPADQTDPLSADRGHPLPVHWAGCERRCGRPAGPAVLVIATGDGYRIDSTGQAGHHTDLDATAAAITSARSALVR